MNYDPDLHALPLFSSAMDVIGQLFLAVAFRWGIAREQTMVVVGGTDIGLANSTALVDVDAIGHVIMRRIAGL